MKSINQFLLLASLLTICPQRASMAQTPTSAMGRWTLQLGNRTFLVVSISPSNGKAGPVTGTVSYPAHFQTANGLSFSHIQGPATVETITSSEWKGNVLSLTVQNPKDPKDKDIYLMSVKDETNASFKLDASLPPFRLKRVTGRVSVSNDWRPEQTYAPDDDAPSNPEMKQIYEEDQRVRQTYPNIDWASVSKTDAERRALTMRLLNQGALHSGEDFTWAAFIFQHGSNPDDYLLAHTLAMVAMRKGAGDATWIAAATLDRYLQSIQQPQIYGTQFPTAEEKPTTQEPFNRTLIPDSLRRQLEVPDLAAQKRPSQ
ncbi:MAG: hypothetical protein M3O31_02395 [Acidobacteriota bacterium]|nr:hypothetical protein [Acidobacteriota bacterium]